MKWNYRVIERDGIFAIHEVYYDQDGKPVGVTSRPAAPMGEDPQELARDLGRYMSAIGQPVIPWHDLAGLTEEPDEPGAYSFAAVVDKP